MSNVENGVTFKMSNVELQQAINDTERMLRNFTEHSDVYQKLTKHFEELLRVQLVRAEVFMAVGMVEVR